MTDDDLLTLADQLRRLGDDLDRPGRDLSGAVLVAIADDPVPVANDWAGRWDTVRRWTAARWRAIVAVLLGGVVVVGVATPVGATVARWFGFGGVVIEQTPGGSGPGSAAGPTMSSESPTERSTGVSTGSGAEPTAMTLEQAADLVGFAPLVPAVLGAPDTVEVSDDDRVVSLLWDRPGGADPLRLDEFHGSLTPVFFKQYYDEVTYTEVNGSEALWLPKPHALEYTDTEGRERTETARTAGPTLVWQSDELTLRLEGEPSQRRALEIAESGGP